MQSVLSVCIQDKYGERTKTTINTFVAEWQAKMKEVGYLLTGAKTGCDIRIVTASGGSGRFEWDALFNAIEADADGKELYVMLLLRKNNDLSPAGQFVPRETAHFERYRDLNAKKGVMVLTVEYHHETGVWSSAKSTTNLKSIQNLADAIQKRFPRDAKPKIRVLTVGEVAQEAQAKLAVDNVFQDLKALQEHIDHLEKQVQQVKVTNKRLDALAVALRVCRETLRGV